MIKLIAEEKCCRTTITFNEHNQEKEDQYLAYLKAKVKEMNKELKRY